MGKHQAGALLVPYLLVLFYLTLVFHTAPRLAPDQRLNLVPCRTIAHFTREAAGLVFRPSLRALWIIGRGFGVNVAGNLAVFMPLGFLLPSLRARPTSAWHALGAGAALSAAIEALQFWSARRTADVDDVLLNALGAMLGYLCFLRFRRRLPLQGFGRDLRQVRGDPIRGRQQLGGE